MSASMFMAWGIAVACGAMAVLSFMLYAGARRKLVLLLKQGVDGLVVVDAQGIVLFLNDAAPGLLGRSRRQLLGELFIAPGICGDSTEITVAGEGGRMRTIEIRKRKMRWKGRSAHLLQLRDVSRRKVMQETMRAQEEQFKAMVAHVPGVVYQWSERADGECGFRFLSPRCDEQLGLDAETIREQWHFPRLHPRGPHAWEEAVRNARNEQADWSFERSIRTRAGRVKWLRDTSRPFVTANGREVLFNGLLLDVGEQKKREERLGRERCEIERAHQSLASQNKHMTDSISYAQSIQHRVLPDVAAILANFGDAFVYLRPRDIVSGDFYWFSRFEDIRLLVCADCTGHGVPGALMTLLGNDLLHSVVTRHLAAHPDELLEQLDRHFTTLSGGSTLPLRDGMEMAVCSLDMQGRLLFAGARLPLFLARRGRPIETVRGTTRAIGESVARRNKHPFVACAFQIEPGDAFYMATDGFQDQPAEAGKRKFKRRELTRLLADLAPLPMAEQARQLNQRFEQWKGNAPQRDDVLVMGVRQGTGFSAEVRT